jgi:[ribosomal protein S18]-alanine N-acetyltransferase
MNQKENTITIRRYSEADKSILLEILQSHVPTYFALEEVEDFSNYLDNKVEQYFVIVHNGIIVGAEGINLTGNGKVGRISWDMIRSDFQGKGLGKGLLNYRIELLKSLKTVEMIQVRTSQLAYQFYESQGFELFEVKKDFWAKGIDLYNMKYKGL